MTKLHVWATLKEAYKAIWAHRWPLLRFAAVPFLLTLLLGYGQFYAAMHFHEFWKADGEPQIPLWSVLVFRFMWFLQQAVILPFLVQGFRLFLLGAPAVADDGLLRVDRATWRLAAVTLVLVLLVFFPYLFQWPYHVAGLIFRLEFGLWREYPLVFVGRIVQWGIYYALLLRLVFVFPAVSLGESWNPRGRWRQTKGNSWPLAGVFAVALCPVLAVEYLDSMIPEYWLVPCDPLGTPSATKAVACYLPMALDHGIFILSGAVFTAVTAVAFAVLTGYPAKGVRVPTGSG